MDLRLNSSFDLSLDGRNDIPTVSGRSEFEQRLALILTDRYQSLIGEIDESILLTMLKQEARRAVNEHDQIEDLYQVSIRPSETEPNVVEVLLVYDTGEDFLLTLTE